MKEITNKTTLIKKKTDRLIGMCNIKANIINTIIILSSSPIVSTEAHTSHCFNDSNNNAITV